MQDRMKMNDHVSVGAQTSEEQLRQLASEGFKSVVNLRTEGEKDQPLSPEAEGEKVRELGLAYLHIPVSAKEPKPEQVDRFRAEVSGLPGPVFVHCASGKRAGAFTMIHQAVESGWSGDETLEKAEQMGFQCDVPELKDFVRGYVDGHAGGGRG